VSVEEGTGDPFNLAIALQVVVGMQCLKMSSEMYQEV